MQAKIIGKLEENLKAELKETKIDFSNNFDLSDEEMEREYSKRIWSRFARLMKVSGFRLSKRKR